MIKPGAELSVCPACGYALGFHTSFISENAEKGNPVKSTRETYRVILICPECGARFDVGWRVLFSEFENRFVRTPVAAPVVTPSPRISVVSGPSSCLPPGNIPP